MRHVRRTPIVWLCCIAVLASAFPAIAQSDVIMGQPPSLGVAIYLACMFTITIFATLITALARRWLWVGFCMLATYALVWQSMEQQYLTGVYWTQVRAPDWLFFLIGHVMLSIFMTLSALSAKRGHWTWACRPYFFGLAGANMVVWLAGQTLFQDHQLTIFDGANIVAMACSFLAVAALAIFDGRDNPRIVLAGMIFPILVVFAYLGLFFGLEVVSLDRFTINRVALGSVILFGFVVLMQRIFTIEAAVKTSMQAALDAARREAETSKSLLEMEREYAHVQEMSRKRRLMVAEAAHDIRQPLNSLRTTIDVIGKGQPPNVKKQINAAFAYLDTITSDFSTEDPKASAGPEPNADAMPVALLFGTLKRMFQSEAERKGLSFQVCAADTDIHADSMTMMRVLSNLVANAIAHTQAGCIELRALEHDAHVRFEVFNTGAVIEPQTLQKYLKSGEKGAASEGSGLGLGIVKRLLDDAGLAFEFKGLPNEGNVFAFNVPKGEPKSPTIH
ncbi:MAG: HAMP domain-containing sensor histidine kinase [Pseudomonadota bacterium]